MTHKRKIDDTPEEAAKAAKTTQTVEPLTREDRRRVDAGWGRVDGQLYKPAKRSAFVHVDLDLAAREFAEEAEQEPLPEEKEPEAPEDDAPNEPAATQETQNEEEDEEVEVVEFHVAEEEESDKDEDDDDGTYSGYCGYPRYQFPRRAYVIDRSTGYICVVKPCDWIPDHLDFTDRDIPIFEKALKKHGPKWQVIKDEYFPRSR
ncbi:Oidioi.mRNA.OKI2018_I69.XSR.g13347.t1.cds [Oikopleura dioica]|uniref:Oidioi.mRNA.OKI2018_I69.XSR.g13347.t1.cds n=1 Tax=Oikopleura dioica TaxID=34765 RepID=A0ABN7SBB3_OIKDI|nr:Oidioi.mRNA.OKI2018_I69.XSR.g13347.t1.cds [Oikopleura dioica]